MHSKRTLRAFVSSTSSAWYEINDAITSIVLIGQIIDFYKTIIRSHVQLYLVSVAFTITTPSDYCELHANEQCRCGSTLLKQRWRSLRRVFSFVHKNQGEIRISATLLFSMYLLSWEYNEWLQLLYHYLLFCWKTVIRGCAV